VKEVFVGKTGKEQGVTGSGSIQECPVGEESYTLRVTTADGSSESKELVLFGGEPSLGSAEVVAQGLVQQVDRSTDVDSTAAGQQAGWEIVVTGIDVLFSGDANWSEDTATLQLPQALVQQQRALGISIDWPINQGQPVEFRAICEETRCSLDAGPGMYLRLRSQ
jgi:hypothetical protein